uniref:USP domain-containing protein n=1 Tax=Knipowitschia caucasica TaxID=637954 RepID=A0AAV2M3H6_KNICA
MLQNVASSLGMTYKCPVQELEFSLDCRRICQTCGKGSRKREDFTNLSLDLCAETTTDKLLENYLKPTQLEYNCTCKGQVSTMSAMFSTLPNILVLHLKRYRYTRDYRLEKVHDGMSIDKALVLSTENTAARFSLVGVISHLGDNAKSGHYIFEGRSPDHDLNNQGDGWLCYNDSQVFKSSRSDVCKNRQRSAYILFYQRTCGTKSTDRK